MKCKKQNLCQIERKKWPFPTQNLPVDYIYNFFPI